MKKQPAPKVKRKETEKEAILRLMLAGKYGRSKFNTRVIGHDYR